MRQLLARKKTVNITGSGSSSCSSQIAGGAKTSVIITSSRPTGITTTEKHHLISPVSSSSVETQLNLAKKSNKLSNSNISRVNINHTDVVSGQDVISGSPVVSSTCS